MAIVLLPVQSSLVSIDGKKKKHINQDFSMLMNYM